jgi:hypothetical protein
VVGTTSGRGASLVTVTYTVVGWHSAGAAGEVAGAETVGADAGGAEAGGAGLDSWVAGGAGLDSWVAGGAGLDSQVAGGDGFDSQVAGGDGLVSQAAGGVFSVSVTGQIVVETATVFVTSTVLCGAVCDSGSTRRDRVDSRSVDGGRSQPDRRSSGCRGLLSGAPRLNLSRRG